MPENIPALVWSRARGTLYGQLAGDALGSMVEFRRAHEIRRLYPEGLREIGPSPVHDTIAGQATDDSELAFELADALIAGGAQGYDPNRAARGYVAWIRSHPFDVGNTIGQACRAMATADASGQDVVQAALMVRNLESLANGALMRHAVLGIWGWNRPEDELVHAAMMDTRLTHPHPICQESSVAYVLALAAAVRLGCSGEEAWRTAVDWHRRAGREPRVRRSLEGAQTEPPAEYSGLVLNALQNAFYQAIHAPSARDGIVATAEAGRDADTNACIAGALLGAIHGVDDLPASWRDSIQQCQPDDTTPQPRPQRYWPARVEQMASNLLET